MPHDTIYNREEKLADHIGRLLDNAERAKFAVGYFSFRASRSCTLSHKAPPSRLSRYSTPPSWWCGFRPAYIQSNWRGAPRSG